LLDCCSVNHCRRPSGPRRPDRPAC
jgi:hypothetical protein